MNEQELKDFKERMAYLAMSGTEDEVRSHINQNFQRLPEDLRHEIAFNLFYTSVAQNNLEQEAVANVQEEGLLAADVLMDAKGELGKDTPAQS